MLNLPGVTLLGIDSFAPWRTAHALILASRYVTFSKTALVTRKTCLGENLGVPILPVLRSPNREERERFMVTRLSETFDTPHCLHMEWDSRLANPDAWDPSWLQWDYIGAPWRYPQKVGSLEVTKDCCVGNMGFSLISKRLADALLQLSSPPAKFVSDIYLCVGLRPALEEMGMRFAPESEALNFSCEDKAYHGQFGWHGKLTAIINRFKL